MSLLLGVLLLALMIRVSVTAGVLTVKALLLGLWVLTAIGAGVVWVVSRNRRST